MTARPIVVGFLLALGAGAAWGVFVQHHQLTDLRADYQQLLAKISASSDAPTASAKGQETAQATPGTAGSAPSLELLQLRNQIGQLTARKRELANVGAENERLRAQLANRGTNSSANKPLPPDYIRKSQAQWVGMNTPENTIQSFLWALQNRDITNALRVFTPEAGEKFLQWRRSPEEFFEDAHGLPGMRLVNQQTLPDGSIRAQVEIVPGEHADSILFRLIDGQWKIAEP